MCYAIKEVKKRCQQDPATKCKVDRQGVDSCAASASGPCLRGFPRGVRVDLKDQIEDKRFEVRKPLALCAPADKDGEDPAAAHELLHYACYQVKRLKGRCEEGAPLNPGRGCKREENCGGVRKQTGYCVLQAKHEPVENIHLSDQFGDELVSTKKELELCVPSQKKPG